MGIMPLMFQHACKLGLEGIVSKHQDSRYHSGRSRHWIKSKNPVYSNPLSSLDPRLSVLILQRCLNW
jgi:ATP-dependent DNA ligase